jgi:hypothetical protein
MKSLKKENERLKKIGADLQLDKLILKESLAALGKMGITNALTAPCEKKSSTQNGSTLHDKPRSLSMFGSGNTTRSDLITH